MKRFNPKPALGSIDTPKPKSTTPQRGGRWHATSKAYRKAHPICADCGSRAATEVHHIIEWHEATEEDRYAWSNLVALCEDCHKGRHSS